MSNEAQTAAGFAPARKSPRRLIANVQAMPKCGKTRLAFTAPKPIGYIAIEVGGEEGVIDQFIKGESTEDILVCPIRMETPEYPNRADYGTDDRDEKRYNEAVAEAMVAVASPALDKFYDAYYYSLQNLVTTVVDTGSDLWELIRLANFGRTEKVPQLAYTQLNKTMDKLLDDAKQYPGNVIFLHHMKEKWENYEDDRGKKQSRATGIFDMAGYSGVKKKVQATIELWRNDLETPSDESGLSVDFFGQIIDSRHNPQAMGARFTTLDIDFPSIAMKIFPGSKRQDWL